MASSRIPRKISDFNDYIKNTDNYLLVVNPDPTPEANWQRLGLSQQADDQWHAMRLAWDTLYTRYSNPVERTKATTASVHTAMETFIAFAQPLLNLMAASPRATDDDAVVFNFKITRAEPTRPTMPIAADCFLSLSSLGGAVVKFACRSDLQNKRASLPNEANSVCIAYKVGDVPPTNPYDGTETAIITRASDLKDLGIEHRGQQVHVFARWYNTHYPEFAGRWSDMSSAWL